MTRFGRLDLLIGMKFALLALTVALLMMGCGQDSLHEAAERGELRSIEQEIANGADINSQNGRDGETPLQRAATRGKYEVAKLLISGGAKVNLGRTKDGETALDLAEDRNHIEVANLLISNGGIRSDGTKYGWFDYIDDIKSWKLKFNDGKIIYAETWKPTGEKCPETSIDRNGNGVVILYREDGSKWRTDYYVNGNISERNFHGMSTRWDENGHKRSESNYFKYKLDGLQTTYWKKNGRKHIEQNYKKGKKDGISTLWYENGRKCSEYNYINGMSHGLQTVWAIDGQKRAEESYKAGKRHGIENTWYHSGQMQRESEWAKGKLLSAEVWKPNGAKCPSTNVKDGNGIVVWYDENGTEVSRKSYIDGEVGLPEKSVKEFKINEELLPKNMLDEIDALINDIEEMSFKEPVEDKEKTDIFPKKNEIKVAVDFSELQNREGVTYFLGSDKPYTGYATLHKNGLKGSEMYYKEGKPHGLWTKWYKSGQKASEMSFKDGKPNGTWTEWYENEQKKSETIWKDGKLADGFRISWFENGQKKDEINFKDGKRDGFAIFYNMDGTEERRESFKGDKRLGDYHLTTPMP